MRQAFCQSLARQAARPDFVFLTGDLGFKALEPLRDALGRRFINAGVAEQNMVSVCAGLARQGLRPWAYSIAPFIYARPFEQVRNDVCAHNLPVTLAGNGGGYGYGVMGGTHHALEDYGVLLTLPRMRVFVPAFDADLEPVTLRLLDGDVHQADGSAAADLAPQHGPAYLRLGLSEEPKTLIPPAWAPFRKLAAGRCGTLVCVGPLAGAVWQPALDLPEAARPGLWCLSQWPAAMPAQLLAEISANGPLCVAEEHVAHGSLGMALLAELGRLGQFPTKFVHRAAVGYPTGRYGSQKFHRAQCGLDAAALLACAAGDASP